jgi:O-succinylbenzoic acid--CoA ligase
MEKAMWMGAVSPTVRDWLSHRADASPDRAALVDSETGASVTFGTLDARVECLAGRLAAAGVGVGDHLGICLDARPAAVVVTHAAMRIGAVLVGLSTRLTPAERRPRIERADLDLLVVGPDDDAVGSDTDVPVWTLGDARGRPEGVPADLAPGAVADIDVDVDAGAVDGRAAPLAAVEPSTFALPDWELHEPLVMVYTSGTTGRPKLVVLTTWNLFTSAVASAFRLGVSPGDRWGSPLAPSSMGGLAPYYRAALYGTGVVLAPTDPAGLRTALAAHDATGVSMVPSLLRRVLDDGPLPDLRAVLLGGAATPPELVERCVDRNVPVCPTYGMTETASQVATAVPGTAGDHPESVGRPLLFTDVAVVEDGRRCPPGEPGELVVSGPTVTPGYYDGTAPFDSHGFHTGDRGYRDGDGRLYVLGRLDERIVTGGQNVDPEEVAAVLRVHADVVGAAVVGLDDPEWGQRVGALVEPASGTDPDADALTEHCRERLAGYKRPRTLVVDSIPRTASGTADRAAVRERLLRAGGAGEPPDGARSDDAGHDDGNCEADE